LSKQNGKLKVTSDKMHHLPDRSTKSDQIWNFETFKMYQAELISSKCTWGGVKNGAKEIKGG
jgi:hypothetical protein